MAQDCQPPSLGIGQTQPLAPELRAKGPVLGDEIGDGVGLALRQPRGEQEIQEAQRPLVDHAGQDSPESGLG